MITFINKMKVIFYRYVSPETPSSPLQVCLGKLYKRNGGGRPKSYSWDRSLMTYRGFQSWKVKQNDTVFLPIYDKTKSLADVVSEYDLCQRFAIKADMPELASQPMNDVMIQAIKKNMPDGTLLTLDIETAISDAYHGGVHYAEQDYKGQGYKYDITSCYPSIAHSDRLFPVGQPTFQYVDDIVDLVTPSLYLVEITKTDHSHAFQFVTVSETAKWYTNMDIVTALELNYDVHLVNDTDNCLTFSESRPGHEIFGDYVPKIFDVKRNTKCPEMKTLAKHFLNKMCGLLAKKKSLCYGTSSGYTLAEGMKQVLAGHKILEAPMFDDEGILIGIKTRDAKQMFSYPDVCHLPAFITSYTRNRLCKLFLKHDCFDHVKQINTDGWILDCPVEWPDNVSKNLGGIKLEASGICHVQNTRKVTWTGETGETP